MHLAARLRELRARRGFTQDHVAKRLGCHESAVSRWESGSRFPTGEDLVALADLFEVSTDDLLGRRAPDRPPVLVATVRAACAAARAVAPELWLCAGGKSMGGRMTSTAMAEKPELGVRALVFLGFPLHPAKQPATTRAEHLGAVTVPMLFVQGTRDALAEPRLLRPIVAKLGATLHEIEGADHGFALPKKAGRDQRAVLAEVAGVIAAWLDSSGSASQL